MPPHRWHSKIGWPLWEWLQECLLRPFERLQRRPGVALITAMAVTYLAIWSRGTQRNTRTVSACIFVALCACEHVVDVYLQCMLGCSSVATSTLGRSRYLQTRHRSHGQNHELRGSGPRRGVACSWSFSQGKKCVGEGGVDCRCNPTTLGRHNFRMRAIDQAHVSTRGRIHLLPRIPCLHGFTIFEVSRW